MNSSHNVTKLLPDCSSECESSTETDVDGPRTVAEVNEPMTSAEINETRTGAEIGEPDDEISKNWMEKQGISLGNCS